MPPGNFNESNEDFALSFKALPRLHHLDIPADWVALCETRSLLDIDFFRFRTLKKSCLYIKLRNAPAFFGCNRQNYALTFNLAKLSVGRPAICFMTLYVVTQCQESRRGTEGNTNSILSFCQEALSCCNNAYGVD